MKLRLLALLMLLTVVLMAQSSGRGRPAMLPNGEQIRVDTDGSFDFTRDDAGVVTITSSDDDSTASLAVDPGGNAILILGSASDTLSVPVTSGITLSNGESLHNATDGTFDFTRNTAGTVTITASDDDATAALTVVPGGAEALSLGDSSTTYIAFATDGPSLDLDNNIAETLTLTASGTNTATFLGADAATPANTTLDTTGAGIVTIGSADVASVAIDTEGLDIDVDGNNDNTVSLENSTTGSVVLDLRDYADTTDDDMAHAALAANCTTTSTGAEDCDLTVNVTEAGNGVTRLTIDGDGHTTFAPEPADGGNGNVQHKIVGIPKIAGFSVGTGNNGANTTNVDFGDSETPATDWIATANMTSADDSSIFRKGTASLRVTVGATPADGNGVDNALATGDQDWSADESIGLWHRCDTAYSAGDWVLEITDSVAGATEVNFPALAATDTWVWTEIDISGVADASKDVITDIAMDLSAAGATTFAAGGICYFDYMWKWDAAEELALTADIYEDGILSMFSVITASAAITPILEVEGTDFFVHYESGNDFIVPITDLSADSLWGMAALE